MPIVKDTGRSPYRWEAKNSAPMQFRRMGCRSVSSLSLTVDDGTTTHRFTRTRTLEVTLETSSFVPHIKLFSEFHDLYSLNCFEIHLGHFFPLLLPLV